MTLDSILTMAVFGGLIPAVLFILLYGFTSPWWKSPGGRHLMAFAVSMFVLFAYGLSVRTLGDYPGRVWITLSVAIILNVLLWSRLVTLLILHFGLIRRQLLYEEEREVDPAEPPA